jgi:hypothetical protein
MGTDLGRAIVEVDRSELAPGTLASKFASGAKVIIVTSWPEIRRAWDLLLEDPEEQLPWNAPLVDIARNHYSGGSLGSNVGDMYYFSRGRLAYIGRKFELERAADGGLRSIPEAFRQGDASFSPGEETRRLCWDVTDAVMQGMIPAGRKDVPYRVAVHRLKYEDHHDDVELLTTLAENAVGRWAQLGARIDRNRETARGPLASKGVSDVFAMLNLVAPARRMLAPLNQALGRKDLVRQVDEHSVIIGKPHFDERFFSGLCGTRISVRTEALLGGRWVRLPIGLDSMVVIPGLPAQKHFGIEPILHRVLQEDDGYEPPAGETGEHHGTANITLLFGTK